MAALVVERGITPQALGCEPGPDFGDVVLAYLRRKREERQEVFDAGEKAQLSAMHAALGG